MLDANQGGNSDYAPANQVQQSFAISAAAAGLSLVAGPSPAVFGQDSHATATVSSAAGAPGGSVQFSVDGASLGTPVTVSGGQAVSPALTGPGGSPLPPGAHQVLAVFTSSDASRYAGAQSSTTEVVDQAATTTALTVQASTLTARVSPVAPGAGTPTGSVSFAVGGRPAGSGALHDGIASVPRSGSAAEAGAVSATYVGDASFTGSSASTSTANPTITASVHSSSPRTPYGWYAAPVTVTFHCTPGSAPLATPCPTAVTLSRGAGGQSVTRTITTTDGGTDTVAIRGIDIDRTRPTVHVTGIRAGAVYPGSAPRAHCAATDHPSGIARCTLTRRTSRGETTVRATAIDRAGNVSSTEVRYRTSNIDLEGARRVNGVFAVRSGRTYTLVVVGSAARPVYLDAAPAPDRPGHPDLPMLAAGRDRWALGVTMGPNLNSHRRWNLGVRIGARVYVVPINVR